MPKRKREGPTDDAENAEVEVYAPKGAKAQRVQHKLAQGSVKIGHAFKVAKGFERQKLGRRQKTAAAQKDDAATQRINAEIGALKALDTTVASRHHLYKTLLKIKAVAISPSLGPEVLQIPAVEHDGPTLNIIARLCNSNPVKEALPDVLAEVQRAAGIDVERAGGKKRMRAKDYENAKKESAKVSPPVKKARNRDVDISRSEDLNGEGAISDDEFADFDDRLASSGDDSNDGDDNDEDMDIEELERKLAQEGIKRKSSLKSKPAYDPAADLSLSDTSRSPSQSPEPQKSSKTTSKPIKASSFVPSLSLGGYISGSDSDPESEIDVAPAKKNRRGQRARQQIWEKKFGTGAKHLVNPKKNDRNAGWDAKRGATDGGVKGRRSFTGGMVRGPKSSGANGEVVAPKKKHNDSEGPLHPSWEAAKKAKEAKAVPVAFAGKKTTFD